MAIEHLAPAAHARPVGRASGAQPSTGSVHADAGAGWHATTCDARGQSAEGRRPRGASAAPSFEPEAPEPSEVLQAATRTRAIGPATPSNTEGTSPAPVRSGTIASIVVAF